MKKNICLLLTIVLIAGAFAGCGKSDDKVVIASKQFTEHILISEMYAQLIENKTDINLERKFNLGGTLVCFPAMEKGEIDTFFEYSGTAYSEILKMDEISGVSAEEIYQRVVDGMAEQFDITMFGSVGFNNTYTLAMKPDKAAELGIVTMSDLANVDGLRFGCGHTFYDRSYDGYTTMLEVYGMEFGDVRRMDSALLYEAIDQGQLDVMVAFSTDGLLKKYNLMLLEDDLEMFPPYQGAPIIRNSTLEKYPELGEVLNLLNGRISNERMQGLNFEIDINNKTPEEVAHVFLTSEGLLD